MQLDVIDPDVQAGVTLDGFDGSIISFRSGCCADCLFDRVFGRNYEVDPVEILFRGQILHYRLVAYVEWIEGAGVDCDFHYCDELAIRKPGIR